MVRISNAHLWMELAVVKKAGKERIALLGSVPTAYSAKIAKKPATVSQKIQKGK